SVQERITQSVSDQSKLNRKQQDREQSVLSIPAVVGESQSGSMLRVIDKIDIAHQGYAMAVGDRRKLTAIYRAEEDQGNYNYEAYKVSAKKNPLDIERISKIR